MRVEIDDAGTGSPVGGVVIGILKGQVFNYRVLPVTLFREESNKTNAEVKDEVLNAVLELLKTVNFDPELDEIYICRGDIFSHVHRYFEEMGYMWLPSKIDSKLQDLVEAAFDFHLVELGVPRLLVKRLYAYWHYVTELLKWVVLDMDSREKFVKTRFPVWKNEWKYARLTFEKGVSNRVLYCIECGDCIEKREQIITVKIKTPRRGVKTYLHKSCFEKLEDRMVNHIESSGVS